MRREATDVPVAQPFPLGSAVSRRQGRVRLIVAEIEAEDLSARSDDNALGWSFCSSSLGIFSESVATHRRWFWFFSPRHFQELFSDA
jgi:hypothetical protein